MRVLGLEIRFPRILNWERRGVERIQVYETLYVVYRDLRTLSSGSGQAHDISIAGVRFSSENKLNKGSPLELTLRFSAGALPRNIQTLQAHAHVIYCHKRFRHHHYHVACAFDDLGEEAARIIQLFISWLKEREQKYLFFRYQPKED